MNEISNNEKTINIESLFNGKLYAGKADFMREFGCGRNTAYRLIREIKDVSDISSMSGKVTKTDFLVWSLLPFKNNDS